MILHISLRPVQFMNLIQNGRGTLGLGVTNLDGKALEPLEKVVLSSVDLTPQQEIFSFSSKEIKM